MRPVFSMFLQRAFTLIEALMTISIVCILLEFSFISWQHLRAQQEDKILQDTVLNTLHSAKQEAQVRGISVGWQVKRNNIEIFVADSLDVLVNNQIDLHAGQLRWRAYPSYRNYLLFLPLGIERADNSTIWYCREQKVRWALAMNKVGKVHDARLDGLGC